MKLEQNLSSQNKNSMLGEIIRAVIQGVGFVLVVFVVLVMIGKGCVAAFGDDIIEDRSIGGQSLEGKPIDSLNILELLMTENDRLTTNNNTLYHDCMVLNKRARYIAEHYEAKEDKEIWADTAERFRSLIKECEK